MANGRLILREDIPLAVFNLGRFLPRQVIPFQAGTVVDQTPLTPVDSLSGEMTFTVGGARYRSVIETDASSRRVSFTWYRED